MSAFIILVAGVIGSHSLITSIAGPATAAPAVKVEGAKASPTPLVVLTVITAPRRPSPSIRRRRLTVRTSHRKTARSLVPTPRPLLASQAAGSVEQVQTSPASGSPASVAPLPTSATVPAPQPVDETAAKLTNYWVAAEKVRRGQIVSFSYVIENPTGAVLHLVLGASIKPRDSRSWTSSISDPYHDVVATILPGKTTHLRYFRVPLNLRPGRYDVAWGLKEPSMGRRVSLVFGAGVLVVE